MYALHSILPPIHHSFPFPLRKQRQVQRTHNSSSRYNPPRLNHRLISKRLPQIPRQMPQSIKAMKRKRQRNRELRRHLHRDRQTAKRRRHARTIQMPSEQRRDKVRSSEDVESAGENGTCDAVQS